MREFSSSLHLDLTVATQHGCMSEASARVFDEALPGFSTLLHEPIPGPVAAVYAAAGTSIDSMSTIQCTWSPGRRVIVRYRIQGSGGDLAGSRDLVAVAGSIPKGAATIEGPDAIIGTWIVPNDPALPGLRSALDVPTLTRLLRDLGSEDDVTRARLRAYRPGRRAVVEVVAGGSSIFLKVVPPGEVEDLHERHRYLSDLLPVPDSLGLSRDLGIVAMRALSGVDLRSVMRRGGALPAPGDLARIVADLPDPKAGWDTRSPIETLPAVTELLGRLLPDEMARLERLAADIGDETTPRSVPVHGDFHEAQILVGSSAPVGLIDVDTFGWGRPGDDPANMLGHLHLLAAGCARPGDVLQLAAALNRLWDQVVDPVNLRLRTAAVVLGLATGPFRVQRERWREETLERIDVAEKWVESAHRVDEKSLIATSGSSHVGIG